MAANWHIPFKSENCEEFCQSAFCKPDRDLVLIPAYVPDTLLNKDFLCSEVILVG